MEKKEQFLIHLLEPRIHGVGTNHEDLHQFLPNRVFSRDVPVRFQRPCKQGTSHNTLLPSRSTSSLSRATSFVPDGSFFQDSWSSRPVTSFLGGCLQRAFRLIARLFDKIATDHARHWTSALHQRIHAQGRYARAPRPEEEPLLLVSVVLSDLPSHSH